MLTIRQDQLEQMAQADPDRPVVMRCNLTWIEVWLVDADDVPVAGASYRIQLSDGSCVEGSLDDKGKARFEGIPAGTCIVSFPEIHKTEWQPAA